MNENQKSSERGQVLVLIALGLVALLGFTALAIDGSMMYSDRRFGQNAADASSLAGGGELGTSLEYANITSNNWSCVDGSSTLQQVAAAFWEAEERALDNGFTITPMNIADVTADSTNYVTFECVNAGRTKYIDIIVDIAVQTNTSFVHFVYNGPVVQRVHSVTRVRPRKFLALGNAVVALNPTSCAGQTEGGGMHGNVQIQINGGGVWSNGCMRVDGDAGDIHIVDGCISYYECPNPASCDNIYEVDIQPFCVYEDPGDQILPEDYALEETPNCGTSDVSGDDIVWVDLTLNGQALLDEEAKLVDTPSPITGLYCIWGDLQLTAHESVVGVDVTLFFRSGDFDATSGDIDVRAVPLDQASTYTGSAVPGVVIYNDAPTPDPTTAAPICSFWLGGNGSTYVEGLVLAPGCDVHIVGNPSMDAHHTQLIGWNVEVGGSAETWIFFDEEKAFSWPTYIDLWR